MSGVARPRPGNRIAAHQINSKGNPLEEGSETMNHVIMQNRRRGWLRGLPVGPGRRARHGLRPDVLVLEDRRLLASLAVTNTNPSGSGSLAAAIAGADGNNQANTITFQGSIWDTPQTITLSGSALDLSDTGGTQTINGPAVGVTISGGGKSGVFQVNQSVTAALSNLTITDGNSTFGGGVLNEGMATLTNCTISGNSASIGGGGLYNFGTAILKNCTISGNTASLEGGGVYNDGNATLTNCTISNNSAYGGGGVNSNWDGTATLNNCTISGNSAQKSGGGVVSFGIAILNYCSITQNSAPIGGGVDNIGSTGNLNAPGMATLTDCSITGNSASTFGGGVYNVGTGTATLENCTIASNTAGTSGGGIEAQATVAVTFSTFTGNRATYGGAIDNDQGHYTVTVEDSILAGDSATTGPEFCNSVTSAGHNLVAETDGGSGWGSSDLTGTVAHPISAVLAPLGQYGGPTETIALLPGSPALGKGIAVSGVTTDQRGFAQDSPIDIGAFQFHSSYSLVVKTTSDSGAPAGEFNLRGAVDQANILKGAQTITFGPTVFATAQTIDLTSGAIVLNQTGGLETITGPAAGVTISGRGDGGVFQVNVGVTAALSNLTITDGNSTFGGGVDNSGTATLTDCTISDNSASFGGGVDNSPSSTMTLTDCTISGNSGGGVDDSLSSTAKLNNCTISGNSGFGVENYGTATLTHCTISGNSDGGGVDNQATATLTDTIVAGNTGPSSAASDISGTHNVTGNNNLIGIGHSGGLKSGQDGNIVLTSLTNLGLAPLAFYGGPIQTMALLPGSAAIGKGIAVSGVTTDQRGFALDSPIDIGAFQTQPSTGTLVVDSTADGSANQPGTLDLRGAVDLANVVPKAQTITFSSTVFAASKTILLTAGPLELNHTQTITGPAARVTISGGGHSGVFQVNPSVTATVSGLTITDGTSAVGGGVFNMGTATLNNCTLSGNSADYGGGGGLLNEGTATLNNCTISGNSAVLGGGVENAGKATLNNCTISRNSAPYGGGVENIGTATLSNCIVSGNSANADGGGVDNDGTGTATLTDCSISDNSANFGGGLYDSSGTTKLTGCTFSSNTAYTGGGLFNASSGSITIDGGTTSGNTANGATGSGGGIFNEGSLNVTDSKIAANHSSVYYGGGLENYHGTVMLTDCTFSGNTATTGGGASNFGGSLTANGWTLSGNSAHFGGGVYNNGTAKLTNCTISGNSALTGGGVYNAGTGTATIADSTLSGNTAAHDGGSSSGGALFDLGKATLTNCTIAGNSASESGGGIEAQGTVAVTFSTFTGNRATYGGAIDNNFGQYTVTVEDSILAGDSASSASFGPEFCNSVTSAGHNLVAETDDSSGWVTSDLTGTAAKPLHALLSALGQYGGPTETIALLPGSPALGTGIAVSGVKTDERGVTRPSTGVDIGAFQSHGFTLTPVSGSTPQSAVIDTAFANPLAVTVTANDSLEPVAGGVIAFAAPSSGATAKLSRATATIGTNGVASINATANNTTGTYHVTALAAGAASASFTLTNTAAPGAAAPASLTSTDIAYQPVFSGLTGHTIIDGTASVTASGAVVYGGDAGFNTSTSADLKPVVNQSAGSSPAVAMRPSGVDQVLAVVHDESSQEVLLGDLAFEQLSSTKPRRK